MPADGGQGGAPQPGKIRPGKAAVRMIANYEKALQFRTLLKSNRELLQQKNSANPASLLELIKSDYEKVLLALTEVKGRSVPALLQRFFEGHDGLLQLLLPTVNLQKLFHVGLEIYEPMDLVVEGFEHWSRRFEQLLGVDIQVVRLLRFPASAAFQKRVKASAEIMRIWMGVEGQELMLELFDIHRPVLQLPSRVPGQFSVSDLRARLVAPGLAPDHDQILQRHFGGDAIWHYAIAVHERQAVTKLQAAFEQLAGQNSTFRLAYPACVYNPHDGSYHTKIIHQHQRLELEFVNHATSAD